MRKEERRLSNRWRLKKMVLGEERRDRRHQKF